MKLSVLRLKIVSSIEKENENNLDNDFKVRKERGFKRKDNKSKSTAKYCFFLIKINAINLKQIVNSYTKKLLSVNLIKTARINIAAFSMVNTLNFLVTIATLSTNRKVTCKLTLRTSIHVIEIFHVNSANLEQQQVLG